MGLGIPRRPDKATAYKQLKEHVATMAVFCLIVRAAPYVLHYFSEDRYEELRLEL
ncbi:hypothetical protein QJS10_CPB17g02572 [Acorus calamus]|uniref:Mitochondrial import receptor subunit TOM6 homolog n=1 Tax=Acorus calamus TaxID=4465 RepID=A0AAV9CYF0_ACOCL|nr:hypothetical protein QJS10_CPB17g02572 [Acorus calamus]